MGLMVCSRSALEWRLPELHKGGFECLHILVNTVQVWNARYMTAAIDHLHRTLPDLVADDTASAGVAPIARAHVNSLGRYELNRQPPPAGQLRPLRLVEDIDQPRPTPPLGVSGDKH